MNHRIVITILSFAAALVLVASPDALSKIDPATLVGMWLFEEGAGDVAKDTSDAGNDGAIEGTQEMARREIRAGTGIQRQ